MKPFGEWPGCIVVPLGCIWILVAMAILLDYMARVALAEVPYLIADWRAKT